MKMMSAVNIMVRFLRMSVAKEANDEDDDWYARIPHVFGGGLQRDARSEQHWHVMKMMSAMSSFPMFVEDVCSETPLLSCSRE